MPSASTGQRFFTQWLTTSEGFQAVEGGRGNFLQGFLGEKALVSSDEDIGEADQASKYVIELNGVAQVAKEQPGFLFVDIKTKIAELAALERFDAGVSIDQSTAAGVDEHDTILHLCELLIADQMIGRFVQRAMQGDDVALREQLRQFHLGEIALLWIWVMDQNFTSKPLHDAGQ